MDNEHKIRIGDWLVTKEEYEKFEPGAIICGEYSPIKDKDKEIDNIKQLLKGFRPKEARSGRTMTGIMIEENEILARVMAYRDEEWKRRKEIYCNHRKEKINIINIVKKIFRNLKK